MESWGSEEHDIRERGLRCTAQRIAVLAVLRSGRNHLRVEEIADLVRVRLGAVSGQAVYDAVAALVRVDLARRIEPAGSPARYEARTGDNHHHVVCRRCGAAADIDCIEGAAPCLDPSSTQGYMIDEAEITFWGVCPSCRPHPDVSGYSSPSHPITTKEPAQ